MLKLRYYFVQDRQALRRLFFFALACPSGLVPEPAEEWESILCIAPRPPALQENSGLRVILAGSDPPRRDKPGSVGRKKAGIRLFPESLLTDKFTKIEQKRTLMAIICPLFQLRALGPRHLQDL
jgi:hypothetical protein